VRGFIQIKAKGVYELRPGYGGSTNNIMEVDGNEVYRKEPGKEAVHAPIKLTAGKKVPFKITYLTDQANGLGWIARIDIPGTLATVVKQDGKFSYVVDKNGNWVERKDVWYKGVVTAGASKWLSVGCGAGNNNIGPELGFGHIVGDFHDEPVLILKASQGNRSLGWDYLPPGSQQFEYEGFVYAGYKDSPSRWEKGSKPKPINWYAGKQYDDCFSAAHKVLNNFDKEFPHWRRVAATRLPDSSGGRATRMAANRTRVGMSRTWCGWSGRCGRSSTHRRPLSPSPRLGSADGKWPVRTRPSPRPNWPSAVTSPSTQSSEATC
jgi:hypothetical protein